MKPIPTLLLSALLVSCIDAVSVPVMYCENEAASAGDCSAEASQAAESTKNWFDSYMISHTDQKRERRHLLDCSRFCNSDVTYFTIHYPCDCTKKRRLTAVEIRHTARILQNDPLVGPIQFFKTFTSQLPQSACRTILEMSRCSVTFVDRYDHDFSIPDNVKAVDESGDVPSHFYLNKSYNPKTGKYEVYDPGTGELLKPETNTNDVDEELPDVRYDPKTNKYYQVDPITGKFIDNEDNSSPTATSENNNDDESSGEMYDPITKTYRRVDPKTGTFIYDDGDAPPANRVDGNEEFTEEVYDPVTGQYHKIDPITGEYIEDVTQYEEVYDPETGKYRKIDPTTGKYVN